MPIKTEFKFDCPTCGQHILAASGWSGRQIECPSCDTRITIPSPPKMPKQSPPVASARPGTPPKPAGGPVRVTLPAKVSKNAAAQTPPPPPASKMLPDDTPAPPEPESLRVAVLTPEVKRDMVRAVRQRIADESVWLPGEVKGANAYAAKISNGQTIPVDVKSPEATRFSLMGAFLLELRLRRVVRTAPGRMELLDEEIPNAIREVLAGGSGGEKREPAGGASAGKDLMSISHAQCLAALDVLEERYSQMMEQARAGKAKSKLGNVRLPDLVRKLENKIRINPEEVATALYHELMDVRRRLDRLESRISQNK